MLFYQKSLPIKAFFFTILTFLFACGAEKNISVNDFDTETWKSDKNACLGKRAEIFKNFEKIKPIVLQMTENELTENFGKPDRNILHERAQRFFGYMIDNCCQTESGKTCRMLQIKLDPFDRVREVAVVPVKL